MLENKRDTETARRRRERRKKHLRKYGRTKLKHSHMGMFSCWMAFGAFALLFFSILDAFLTKGTAAGIVGGLGMASAIAAVFGIRSAVKGLKEREKKYMICKIGIAANLMVFVLIFVIYICGFAQ